MAIKSVYEKKEDIPQAHVDLFTERNGKWELTGVEGMKTSADVERVQEALAKEKNDHKEVREKLRVFRGVDPDKLHDDLDELTELRATKAAFESGDKTNQEEIDKIVDARVAKEKGPLERELVTLKEDHLTTTTERDTFQKEISDGKLETQIRKAAQDANVISSAIDDIVLNAHRDFELGEDGQAMTKDGLDASTWMNDRKEDRSHWWPTSEGGGSKGSDGKGGSADNPWTKANWNVTKQGQLAQADQTNAEKLAKMAGSSLGGLKPEK